MEEFIGRQRELALLEEAWGGAGSALVPLHGRRRVGKSELLLRFLRGKRAVYHLGKPARPELRIRDLLSAAALALDEPLLASLSVTGWKQALETVVARVPAGQKLAVALDEFQWTAQASPELPAVLQELWDRQWRSSGSLMLVPCGSYVGFMEREVLGRKSPLFGRRTGQILLRPFPFHEAARFHPGWGLVEQARVYFLCGGVPHYLRQFRRERSVEMSLVASVLEEHGALHREPDFLLREELRDVENYYAVLLAIARGAGAHADIARTSGIPNRSLHYYLQQLVELGYVARRHPLAGEGRPSRRQVRYVLEDPLLRFWFRFVDPSGSVLAQLGASRLFAERIRPELEAWYGQGFERLCREALPYLYRREGVSCTWQVGSYWSRDVEIDVVGLRSDGFVDLGECKWGTASPSAVAAELEAKVSRFPNPGNSTVVRRLFLRNPPRRPPVSDTLRRHALADLYAAASA